MNWILVTALFVLVCHLSKADIELDFSPSGLIREGDELTITCTIDKYKQFELLKLVRKIEGTQFSVAVNGVKQGGFQQQERYEVIDGDNNLINGVQIVSIKGVRGADRGQWLCVHIMNNNNPLETAIETINIIVPPSDLRLSQKTHQGTYIGVEEGETLIFSEGQEAGIKCVVNTEGTLKPPKVTITLGDKDITEMFNKVDSESFDVEDGLYVEEIEVTYTGYTDPKPEDNDKTLTCTAKAENHDQKLSSSVTVQVHYKPKLTCSQSPMMAKPDSPVEISCTADMLPKYDTAMWSFEQAGASVSLNPDDMSTDGNIHFMVTESGSSYTFMLHVKSVGAEGFQMYSLEVTNSQGTAIDRVQLEEVVDPVTPPRAPTTTVVNNNNNNNNNQGTVSPVLDDGNGCPPQLSSILTVLSLIAVSRLL